ncbi:ATP-NAD kinase [Metschnikowia bicuspidata var. bicuspidata NRRL YB-4993]|uniref:ATP-NAD kinase n=1 Tax=Metschnikowia bicuspidata var. bicuspidata NRRL YB-4993 TaxID=869754 RepID=A0A1A0H8G3_9ASCO|nr:ATP-NAD kinase [Metschnikowia bicuspidata var. bicuspidata NRRL YB-4993]OBA20404.1 ATP-NAD kinase [Metschnikowia bicuspidata var. bicuspidata NRRL YB-4993]
MSTQKALKVPAHTPENAGSCGATNLVSVSPCSQLSARTIPKYAGSAHSKLHNVVWRSPLQNIYVVKKPWNETTTRAMREFIAFIHAEYPSLNVIVSEDVKNTCTTPLAVHTGSVADIVAKTDLIVSLGGDGTTLRAVLAFLNGSVPPVLCFAMGTLGFLLPFDFASFRESFRAVFESRGKAIHRTRLECHVLAHYKQHHDATMVYAMNDISLHRGAQPGLIKLDIYIDSEYLTSTTADGLVFATPTGSTAYSLSAGGPIAHPLVPCILLTPICPQSLSFRPLVLPATSHVMIRLLAGTRAERIKMSIDGIAQPDLRPGDEIHVVNENGTIYIPGSHQPPKTLRSRLGFDDYIEPGRAGGPAPADQPNGIFCFAKAENDWTVGITELLGFNSSFKGQKH